MDARRHKRKITNIKAELIKGEMRCASFIENLSDAGIYLVTTPTDSSMDFPPETEVLIRFALPSGERLELMCLIKWSYKTPPYGLTSSIGMEILNPPPIYKEGLKELI